MENQIETIKNFCKNARYYWVRYESQPDGEFGKILNGKEIEALNLNKHELHRSIEYQSDDTLFVYDLKPSASGYANNPLKLLLNNLEEARVIETVYPSIFRWAFDGLSIKAYAIVPSGNPKEHSTLTRYGGTRMFMKILRQHLRNIGKMNRGITPDYSFLSVEENVDNMELSLGSINKFTDLFSVGINLGMDYKTILLNSKKNIQVWQPITQIHMKYWAKEINPDFISEAKHIKLDQQLTIDEGWKLYPKPIKRLMKLKHKGNYNRFLLARFLLSVHSPTDAKHQYLTVMGEEERAHVTKGDCSTQWNYVLNNHKRYDCPSMKELKSFCTTKDIEELSHPLEKIQEYLEKKKNENYRQN